MTAAELDLEAVLAEHPLTAPLPSDVRQRLAALVSRRDLDPGDVLVEEGTTGDAAFLVVAGRLSASVAGVPVGTIGPGETVGEMALLTGARRTATVMAKRPSIVLSLGADDFAAVLADHPEAHRALTAQLVSRLDSTLRGRSRSDDQATVIAVTGDDRALGDRVGHRLAASIAALGTTVAGPVAVSGTDLLRLEVDHDVVIVAADSERLGPGPSPFDRVVYITPAARRGRLALSARGATDLVLVHDDHVRLPNGTRDLLRQADDPGPIGGSRARPVVHHHLRSSSTTDADRLARRLLSREQVLVLGGGGARGLAHLGVYRALTEAGIEIDAVVGVSAGAIFAACVALDWTPDEAIAQSTAVLIEPGRLVDLTVPMVALSSGRRVTDAIRTGFGADADVEDLWRPLTCLSADLTTLSSRIHTDGPLWRALRASVAVPGVFPPLVEGDAVLVDGGVVDNLPVSLARELYPGATIISSDVGRRAETMTVDLPPDGVVSGWRSLWHRIGRRRQTPTMVKLLYRLTALGGGADTLVEGDIHISHELAGIGVFDFGRGRPAIDAGYQRTLSVLSAHPSPLCVSATARQTAEAAK
ncbi:MAG: patatin-like phospholipase domain-containing protein [Acidimicrobiia bacterium]|nr:patatin-like phospholipase domain-containing protein [Acidimicrobiia bacterium]